MEVMPTVSGRASSMPTGELTDAAIACAGMLRGHAWSRAEAAAPTRRPQQE